MTCRDFRPDHNGECLNCDEWYGEHKRQAELRACLEFMAAEYRRTGRVQDDSEITPEMEARFRTFVAEYLKAEGL